MDFNVKNKCSFCFKKATDRFAISYTTIAKVTFYNRLLACEDHKDKASTELKEWALAQRQADFESHYGGAKIE